MRFGLFNTVVFFMFFCISAEYPSRVFETCARIGNDMLRKRKISVTKKVVSFGQKKNDADAHPQGLNESSAMNEKEKKFDACKKTREGWEL